MDLESTGGDYCLREATPGDVPLIHALYCGLSPIAVHARFSCWMSEQGLHDAANLSKDAISVIALSGSGIAGEARYAPWEGVQEFAITVDEAHQGHGLGTLLLKHLRHVARARGLTSLRAVIQADNARMLSIVRRLGMVIVVPPTGGEVVIDIASDDYMPDWSGSPRRPRILVESPHLAESRETEALRRAGFDVRLCLGPRAGQATCPLVMQGRCRMAEEADVIASLIPDDGDFAGPIVEEHQRRSRPGRLLALGGTEWRQAVSELLQTSPLDSGSIN